MFQSPGDASMSYSAKSTKLFSLILRTLTKSPHSWTWINPLSPLPYSISLSFSVTSVRLPQAWRYMYLTPTTSTMPKPAEQPRSMPSSQALCLGMMSGYFGVSEGLEGRLGFVLGRFGFNLWPRFSLKFGWGSEFGWTIVLGVGRWRLGSGLDGLMWFWISNLWPRVSCWEGTGVEVDVKGW